MLVDCQYSVRPYHDLVPGRKSPVLYHKTDSHLTNIMASNASVCTHRSEGDMHKR